MEREAAALFGTKRTPLSGSNSGHDTNSDSLHPRLYIEAKYRAKFGLVSLFRSIEKAAAKEKKLPVLVLKEKNMPGVLLMVRPADIAAIYGELRLSELLGQPSPTDCLCS